MVVGALYSTILAVFIVVDGELDLVSSCDGNRWNEHEGYGNTKSESMSARQRLVWFFFICVLLLSLEISCVDWSFVRQGKDFYTRMLIMTFVLDIETIIGVFIFSSRSW